MQQHLLNVSSAAKSLDMTVDRFRGLRKRNYKGLAEIGRLIGKRLYMTPEEIQAWAKKFWEE